MVKLGLCSMRSLSVISFNTFIKSRDSWWLEKVCPRPQHCTHPAPEDAAHCLGMWIFGLQSVNEEGKHYHCLYSSAILSWMDTEEILDNQ